MKLSKYPVTTDRGEYLVEINMDHVCLDLYQWVAKVYIKKEITIPFIKIKITKNYKVFTYETGYFLYEKYIGKYVELAKEAVKNYEDWLEEEEEKERLHNRGIEEWNKWDGKVN